MALPISLQPTTHLLLVSLLYSFIYGCLCSAPRLPWGILLPACFMMPWHNLKVQSLVASKNTAERAVADWIKQINTAPIFQTLVPWANSICFSIIPLQGLLWRKQGCVGTDFGGVMLCMCQEIWRYFFFLVIRGLILKHFERWARVQLREGICNWSNNCKLEQCVWCNTKWTVKTMCT